jgi:hypothetical protein
MMKTFTTILVTLSFLAPSTAQISGSINRDAPSVSAAVSFKNKSKLSVNYTAIHFGEGQWQSILKNTRRHERFNSGAARRPLGSITTNSVVSASGKEIPAGDYSMFFTVHESAGWLMNLKNKKDDKAEAIRWRMVMTDTKSDNKRFKVEVNPGADTGTASITISFGKKSVSVPLKVAAPADAVEVPAAEKKQ